MFFWVLIASYCFVATGSATVPDAAPTRGPAVVVYGSTPGAIMAAVSASRVLKGSSTENNLTVFLIDPAARLGGMSAGGLGRSDIGNPIVIGGLAHEFFVRVANSYGVGGGSNSSTSTPLYYLEPHVAEKAFSSMLAGEDGRLVYMKGHGPVVAAPMSGGKITQVTLEDGTVVGDANSIYIDGSYEGDLMARTGNGTAGGGITYTYVCARSTVGVSGVMLR